MKKKGPIRKALKGRVSKKIAHLVKEGTPQRQAIATALSMARKKRIGIGGEYIPVKQK